MSSVAIVTTAAPPWMTGTAINPSMRAAHLCKRGYRVCIVYPWISLTHQGLLFGTTFSTMRQQEDYIRAWIKDHAECEFVGHIVFYPANYEPRIGSIVQKSNVDITTLIPIRYRDIAILEEPEHINWLHRGRPWDLVFKCVVGVLHTNYVQYSQDRHGWVSSQATKLAGALLCTAYTDLNIHLSNSTVKTGIPGIVCNIHGVRPHFFADRQKGEPVHTAGKVYFLGKAVWTKGYANLFHAYARLRERLPHITTFGSGPDFEEIAQCASKHHQITHNMQKEHTPPQFSEYIVFFNPSVSDVMCTATSEALAMGKYVIIPRHVCNEYFYNFRNCMTYADDRDLLQCFCAVFESPPVALNTWEKTQLSWEYCTSLLTNILENVVRKPRSHVSAGRHMCRFVHRATHTQPFHNVLRTFMGVSHAQMHRDEVDAIIRSTAYAAAGIVATITFSQGANR